MTIVYSKPSTVQVKDFTPCYYTPQRGKMKQFTFKRWFKQASIEHVLHVAIYFVILITAG